MLSCHCIVILKFLTRGLYFHFAVGSPNSVAVPDQIYVTSGAGEKGNEAIPPSRDFVMADTGGCGKWGFYADIRSLALQHSPMK